MKIKNYQKPFIFLIQVLVTGFFLYFVLKVLASNWVKLPEHLAHINYWYFLFAFILFAASFFIQSETWYLIIRSLGADLNPKEHFTIYFYPKIAAYAPGGVWNILGRMRLAERKGVSKLKTLYSSILELIFSVAAGTFLFFFAFLINPKFSPSSVLIAVLLFLFSFTCLWPPVLTRISKIVFWVKQQRFNIHISFKKILLILNLSLIYWLVFGLGFFLLIKSLHPISLKFLLVVAGVNAFSWLIGFLVPFAAGGLGITEVLLMSFLGSFLPLSIAALVPILGRIISIISELSTIGAVWLYNRRK